MQSQRSFHFAVVNCGSELAFHLDMAYHITKADSSTLTALRGS